MKAHIQPHGLAGLVPAIASKSVAHRDLILAALCPATTDIHCNATSKDIEATARVLEALGAGIARTRQGFRVVGIGSAGREAAGNALLDCGESGSTLRFMLPVVAALGRDGRFTGQGRLAERPLSPLYEELCAHGCTLSAQGRFPLELSGKLSGRTFRLKGDVSSQLVSGLLLAAPRMDAPVQVLVEEPVESRPYIDLTLSALRSFGVETAVTAVEADGVRCLSYAIDPLATPIASPGLLEVEGDWSNAAFWLAAGAIGEDPVSMTGLDASSVQGDRAILGALALLGARVSRKGGQVTVARDRLHAVTMDVHDVPDLVPILAAAACSAPDTTRLVGAARLRLKESDRLETTAAALTAMGGQVFVEDDGLAIQGGAPLSGGTVDAANDHRIAMAAAIAATTATGPTTILGAECVEKSYPAFFEDFASLGGIVEKEA